MKTKQTGAADATGTRKDTDRTPDVTPAPEFSRKAPGTDTVGQPRVDEEVIDLNRLLIAHAEATYVIVVEGTQKRPTVDGLPELVAGDYLLVDKLLVPRSNALTLRYGRRGLDFAPGDSDLPLFGVVTHIIRPCSLGRVRPRVVRVP